MPVEAARTRIPWLPMLAAVGLALAVFGRTWSGGFLSDDFLLNALRVADAAEPRVDWAGVFADFARPWLGFDLPFYRPMLSVSLAIDDAIGGGRPLPFHLTNLALHAIVTASAALLAARLAPARPMLAAWIAGAVVAVHPVAAEPVAWIAARNSELEVTFRTLALLAFAVHLRSGTRRSKLLALVLAALALSTKESAIVLPAALVAIDLIDAPRRAWSARLRLHLPFAVLTVGYLALRVALFGTLVGESGATPIGSAAGRFGAKLLAMSGGPPAFALPLCGLVLVGGWCRARTVLVVGLAWIALEAAPTWQLAMSEGLGGSRMIYGALPAIGVTLAAILVASPWPRAMAVSATAGALLLLWPVTDTRLDAFADAWRDMDAARAGIASLAARTDAERPLAIAAMPPNAAGIPPCNPNAWFPLAERPHQAIDIPVVSLGFITVAVPGAETLLHDSSATRAMAEIGATIATWAHAERRFLSRRRDAADFALPKLEPVVDRAGSYRFQNPAPPAERVEALHLEVAGEPTAVRVTFACAVSLPADLGVIELGRVASAGGTTSFDVDLSHHVGLASLGTFGLPLTGFDIVVEGPAELRAVAAFARVPELPLATPLAGSVGDLGLLEGLTAPTLATSHATLRLIVLGPHSAMPVPCTPGEHVVVPELIRRELSDFARVSRQDRFWFWFEARTEPGSAGFARSPVDQFVLRPRAR